MYIYMWRHMDSSLLPPQKWLTGRSVGRPMKEATFRYEYFLFRILLQEVGRKTGFVKRSRKHLFTRFSNALVEFWEFLRPSLGGLLSSRIDLGLEVKKQHNMVDWWVMRGKRRRRREKKEKKRKQKRKQKKTKWNETKQERKKERKKVMSWSQEK